MLAPTKYKVGINLVFFAIVVIFENKAAEKIRILKASQDKQVQLQALRQVIHQSKTLYYVFQNFFAEWLMDRFFRLLPLTEERNIA